MVNAICTVLFALLSLMFPADEATIVFAGDAMQHQRQLDAAKVKGGDYDYSQCFKEVAPWIAEADYAVVNLETTLNGRNYSGYPCFCTPDAFATALRDAGFDMMLNGNNHTLDRGASGLHRTIHVLDSLKVDHLGTYDSAHQRKDKIPFIKDINGFKVGFLNYTFCTNGLTVKDSSVVDYTDRKLMAADIEATRRAGAELVVVIPHWGTEYRLLPDSWQKSMAEYLLDLDVDMVIGGHPHVIQPMKVRVSPKTGRRQLLVYSLGNFISGMRTTDTRGGALVLTRITRDAKGRAQFDTAEYRLVYVLPGTSPANNYQLVYIDPATSVSAAAGPMASACRAFTANALRIFDNNNVDVPRYGAQPTKP